MGKNYIVNRILLGQISQQAWHGVVSKILTCNICRIKNESVLRSNTYLLYAQKYAFTFPTSSVHVVTL